MGTLIQDFRYSLRLLLKNPGATAILILTLALGIGANTAVFTVINGLYFHPLPFRNADRIAFVWESRTSDPLFEDSLSPHNFTDIHNGNSSFESYFAYEYSNMAITGAAQPESLVALRASSDIGRVLGVSPVLGRWFAVDEDVPGKNHVAVLSNGLWQRRFGSDPNVVGRHFQLDEETYVIIGVMPAGFRFPHPDVELWAPLALDLSKFQRGTSFLTTVARMKPDVTIDAANSDLIRIANQFKKEYPNNVGPDFTLRAESIKEHLFGSMKRPLAILFAAVTFVLLIACVNVANLMLGRSTARSKEMAVRSALGASRSRLVRLLLIEGALLALAGGAVGLLIAAYGVQALTSIYPTVFPAMVSHLAMDVWVLAFTLLISIMTGLLFAIAPAWHVTRASTSQTLHDNSRSVTASRGMSQFRGALVVAEISLSLLLLIGSALLLRSLWKVLDVKPGFESHNVVTCSLSLSKHRYPDPHQQARFFQQTLEAVKAIAGVESAALATSLPFSGSRGASSFSIDGRPMPANNNGPEADRHQISPGYFHAMQITLRTGRDFTNADSFSAKQVVVINDTAAKKFWPGENPLGKRITIGMPVETEIYGKAVSREIVGIVGNVKHADLTEDSHPEMYIPAWQLPSANMTLVVRGHAAPETILTDVRRVLQSIDPEQPVRSVKLLQDSVARSVTPHKFLTTLLISFACLALLLSLIGTYAVMSFSVRQRYQEIGVRMALGATTSDALALVLRQGIQLAVIGMAAGLILTFALTGMLRNQLYEVSATDPLTILVVSILLLIVTVFACLIPARRASRIDPLVAIRYE